MDRMIVKTTTPSSKDHGMMGMENHPVIRTLYDHVDVSSHYTWGCITTRYSSLILKYVSFCRKRYVNVTVLYFSKNETFAEIMFTCCLPQNKTYYIYIANAKNLDFRSLFSGTFLNLP